MKRFFLLAILLSHIAISFATDYSRIDERSHYVPFQLKTPVEIAKYLTQNLRTEEEKVRAIYFWIATNIRFDVIQLPGTDYRFNVNGRRNFLKEVLDSHKGVCQHYAILFDTLCHSVGIKSFLITGYTKQKEVFSPLSHAWNAVLINGKFYELDVTWSAGYVEEDKFIPDFKDDLFMVAPSKFIYTHIPFDPVWQFLNNPVSHFAVKKNDYSCLKSRGKFNFVDSIKVIGARDSLTNFLCENKRIISSGITNNMIRMYISYNQQNIALLKYNLVVFNFNKAIERYNTYIDCKNKQFDKTSMDDAEIQNLITDSRSKLEKAESGMQSIKITDEPLYNDMHSLQRMIKKLRLEIGSEEIFVIKYISTAKPLRMSLFAK